MKMNYSIRFSAFLIAAIALTGISAFGQITVDPPILNNASPFLSDWQSRASTAQITVHNSGAARQVKIVVHFFLNGSEVAYTQCEKLKKIYLLPAGSIQSPSISFFNGEDVAPFSAVHFEGAVDQNAQRAGRIPDGLLCIIVHIVDAKTCADLAVSPNGCQAILSFSPPVLILPADKDSLCKLGFDNVLYKANGQPMPMFQWAPIVPSSAGYVRYHFAIFEVLPGQAPIAAFQGARSVFETGNSFLPDPINVTSLLWPTQYFLPEKGKTYIWSVRALDIDGNPFILTNGGWATPFTFTVPLNCDQGSSGGNLSDVLVINPMTIDFGSVNLGTTSASRQISITNKGTGTISIHPPDIVPPGSSLGFAIDLQPSFLSLDPGVSSSFTVTFKPQSVGMVDGSVRIATDGGTATIPLKGQGVEATAPTIKIISPAGGENLSPGSAYNIKFSASDNSGLTNYHVSYSTDGGAFFGNTITPADNSAINPPIVMWNIPPDVQTPQAQIKITAQDKSGNQIYALSGLFSIGAAGAGNGSGKTGGTGQNGSTDSFLNGDPTSYTFIPLALEILTPSGAVQNLSILPAVQRMVDGTLDLPPGLTEPSPSRNTAGGVMLTLSDKTNSTGGSKYAFQYRETDFDFLTSGKGPINITDLTGNTINASLIYPESNDFLDAESFRNWDSHMTPGSHHSSDETSGDNSKIKITPIQGGGDPIFANSITIVPAGNNTVEFELFFDTYEDKKSVRPALQKLLEWVGTQNDKNGRVKVKFFWDRDGKNMDVDVNTGRVKYTMFLPDGTPCRATCTFKGRLQDNSDMALLTSENKARNASIFFNTNIGPQTLQLLQGSQSDQPILSDPVFADRERELRAALKQNLGTLIQGYDISHQSGRVRGWNPETKQGIDNTQSDKFTFEIDGVMVPGVHSVDGLGHGHEVSEYQEGGKNELTGGNNHVPGAITVTKDWSNTSEWYNWKRSADRKSISVIFRNDAGEETRRYNLFDCFPTKYQEPAADAKNSGHATETIEISYEDFDVQPKVWHLSGDLKSMKGSISSTQQTTLLLPASVGGEKSDLMLIGLLMPPQGVAPVSSNTSNVNADLSGWKWQAFVPDNSGNSNGGSGNTGNEAKDKRGYVSGHYALDLDGIRAGIITNVEGGGVTGDIATGKPAPGSMDIIPASSAFYDWIKSSFDPKYSRKSGAIHSADYNRDIRYTRHFQDALITEITFPGGDGSAKDAAFINLTWAPEKISNKPDSSKNNQEKFVADPKIQKKWMPANFRLKIDGLDDACKHINKIESFTIKQSIAGSHNTNQTRLVFSVPVEYAKAFAIKGNNDESKHRQGSLTYLNGEDTPLITFDFTEVKITRESMDRSENKSNDSRTVVLELYLDNLTVQK
jgi:phage tail-like protein